MRAGADDDVEEPEYNPWADVAVTSLHDDMAGRNVNQLWRAIEAGAVHKKACALSAGGESSAVPFDAAIAGMGIRRVLGRRRAIELVAYRCGQASFEGGAWLSAVSANARPRPIVHVAHS